MKHYELVEHFEGLRLEAYKCPAGVWTIGIGTTVYPDREKVKRGDVITREYAMECLRHDMAVVEFQIRQITTASLNEYQRGALASFTYNLGLRAFMNSTLLKKVNANPEDPTIQQEFEKWVLAGGKRLEGLVRRRKAEAWLYFHGTLNFNP